ncbi:cartilage intermediate layer protein 1-like isoform X2 [Vanacampus margaritifer]
MDDIFDRDSGWFDLHKLPVHTQSLSLSEQVTAATLVMAEALPPRRRRKMKNLLNEWMRTNCDKVCRTPWYDRDNPSGNGDFETLETLGIKVQTVAGNTVASTGDVIAVMDATAGFICKNADQEGRRCSDYQVRFIRPIDFFRRRG